ncbi:hypothetical protein ACLKMH_15490 [Psychromonas sp. KJ10-10]|uniref:hypothetical protein n=1 Tax=Psychromonas sp. KJ10-10 TaxID=3391823 RepID=UPI0039B4970B
MNHDKTVKVTFIHTAQVLVKVFSDLIEKHQLNITAQHVVHSELLERAIKQGMTTELAEKIKETCISYSKDSELVVCTCSSLGEVAENIRLENGKQVIRIDRAMANTAVHSGENILVLAALESTLAPTATVLNSSQKIEKTDNNIEYHVVENCWPFFLDGEINKYHQAIADVIAQKQDNYDCIVLAQASMTDAISLVKDKRALMLSSPDIGIQLLAKQLIQ